MHHFKVPKIINSMDLKLPAWKKIVVIGNMIQHFGSCFVVLTSSLSLISYSPIVLVLKSWSASVTTNPQYVLNGNGSSNWLWPTWVQSCFRFFLQVNPI